VQPLGGYIFTIINNPPASDPTGPYSLWIVDASNSSAPVLYPFATQFGMSDVGAAVVSASVGYLLVPNTNGLAIYSFQP
jgi:hypothetical protein